MNGKLSIGNRLLRSAVFAILGSGAGLVLMLSIDFWKRPYAANSLLLPAAVIGAAVGATLGFFLTDADWLDLFRKP
jgi:ABC-type proline/glycine betaine transport system permease subunit